MDRTKSFRAKNGISLEDVSWLGFTGNDLGASYSDEGDLVIRSYVDGQGQKAQLFLKKVASYVRLFDSKCNLSAIVNPVVGNDNTQGYSIGSIWANTATQQIFLCADATTGASVWKEVGGGSGASDHKVISDATDTTADYLGNKITTDATMQVAVSGTGNRKTNIANLLPALTKEPTGFTDPANVVVTYNPSARTITLTGSVSAYWQGIPITALVAGWVSPAHASGVGDYYLYYDGTTLGWSNTIWTLDLLPIASVKVTSTLVIAIRECHGMMPWQVHKELHSVIGTYLVSGGDLSGYTLNSNTASLRRPAIAQTIVADEDLQSTLTALATNSYSWMWLTSTGLANLTTGNAEIVALNGATPYYNQYTGGNWVQTPMTNGNYQTIFVLAVPVTASSDASNEPRRYIFLQGQSVYTTLAQAQAVSFSSINTGDIPSGAWQEYVSIAQVVVGMSGNDWSIASVAKITGSRVSMSSSFNGLSVVTTDASLSGQGTTGSPLAVVGAPLSANAEQYELLVYAHAVSTANQATLSGPQTIDGIALTAGQFVLLKNQTTASQNGLWVVNAGAWTRAVGYNTDAKVRERWVLCISDGTTNKLGSTFVCTNATAVTLDTTSLTYSQVPMAFSTTATDIKVDGTQSLGSLNTLPRADHIHPSDTTRIATSGGTATGALGARSFPVTSQTINQSAGAGTATWTLTSGNALLLNLASATIDLTLTLASPASNATSYLNITGAVGARLCTLSLASSTFIFKGVASSTTIVLPSVGISKRYVYRLYWATALICYIDLVATDDATITDNTLSLTTTGTSGAATLVGNVLNIPQYAGGGGANKELTMRYLKNFSGGVQLANPFDTNPLMTDQYGYDTSINGGFQYSMTGFRGAFVAGATYNKISVGGYLRPYNVGAGAPAASGQVITFTLNFVESTSTNRSVFTTQTFNVTTTELLNQNQGQQASNPVFFTFDATLATPITAGKVMGLSITCPTIWGVIGDVALTINFRAE